MCSPLENQVVAKSHRADKFWHLKHRSVGPASDGSHKAKRSIVVIVRRGTVNGCQPHHSHSKRSRMAHPSQEQTIPAVCAPVLQPRVVHCSVGNCSRRRVGPECRKRFVGKERRFPTAELRWSIEEWEIGNLPSPERELEPVRLRRGRNPSGPGLPPQYQSESSPVVENRRSGMDSNLISESPESRCGTRYRKAPSTESTACLPKRFLLFAAVIGSSEA